MAGRELVLLVAYKADNSANSPISVLRIFLLRLDGLVLIPTVMTYTIPPPDPANPAASSTSSSNASNMRIDFVVTPVIEPTQSDYLYLVCGSELALFSLSTGQRVQPKMSDADKGFNFMMRGLVPGTFPPWRFEVRARAGQAGASELAGFFCWAGRQGRTRTRPVVSVVLTGGSMAPDTVPAVCDLPALRCAATTAGWLSSVPRCKRSASGTWRRRPRRRARGRRRTSSCGRTGGPCSWCWAGAARRWK